MSYKLRAIPFVLLAICSLTTGLMYSKTVSAEETVPVVWRWTTQGTQVTSQPAGINCPGTCQADFPKGSTINFTIAGFPNDRVFLGLGPILVTTPGAQNVPEYCTDQAGASNTVMQCAVTIPAGWTRAEYVMYTSFKNIGYQIVTQGTGGGKVTSDNGSLSCGIICTTTVPYGKKFTVTAHPNADSEFTGWNHLSEVADICDGDFYTYRRGTWYAAGNDCYVTAKEGDRPVLKIVAIFNKKGSSAANQPKTIQAALAAPTLGSTQRNGQNIQKDANDISLDADEELRISGQAPVNSSVHLYIHSELREAIISADKDGRWEYVISGLESGDHYIEAQSVSADGQKTSDKVKLLSFRVKEEAAKSVDDAGGSLAKEGTTWLYLLLTGMLVAAPTLLFIAKKRPTALNPIRRFWAQSKQHIRKLLRK